MGLDASVFCDCFEKGRLINAPPTGVALTVEPDGSLWYRGSSLSLESQFEFDRWRHSACKHPGGVLLHHRLGNISLIGMLRSELQRDASRFPILLGKVLYSESHAGDFLGVDLVPSLRAEVEALVEFRCSNRKTQEFMDQFHTQMSDLISASISVNKPIVF